MLEPTCSQIYTDAQVACRSPTLFFSFVLLLFSASVRAFLFPFLFFFANLVPFSPLSFFLSPVSLALLLPPLLFGLFFPPDIAVNMAQVPAKTGWAMWSRLRGRGLASPE